jgi:hypothetical protein
MTCDAQRDALIATKRNAMTTNETNVTNANDATINANDATTRDALTTTQHNAIERDAIATTQRAKRVRRVVNDDAQRIARRTNAKRVASNATTTHRVDNVSNANTIDDATRERRIDALCHALNALHIDARTHDTRKQQKTIRRRLRALTYFISRTDTNDFAMRVARHAKRDASRNAKHDATTNDA